MVASLTPAMLSEPADGAFGEDGAGVGRLVPVVPVCKEIVGSWRLTSVECIGSVLNLWALVFGVL